MASAAQSLAAFGFTATPTIAQTRKKVPMPSAIMPGKMSPSRRFETDTAP